MNKIWWYLLAIVGAIIGAVVLRHYVPALEQAFILVGLSPTLEAVEDSFMQLVGGNPSMIISVITGSIGGITLLLKRLGDTRKAADEAISGVVSDFNLQMTNAQQQMLDLKTNHEQEKTAWQTQLQQAVTENGGLTSQVSDLNSQLIQVQQQLAETQNELKTAIIQRDEFQIQVVEQTKQTFH